MQTLKDFYNKQVEFQKLVARKYPYDFAVVNIPEDNVQACSYHIQQLISEIGEILSADKRWKNYRNNKHDAENKSEEIADCFIVLMNIAIFSGLSADEFEDIIVSKMNGNFDRIK